MTQQECIPVGCVPSAAVAVPGESPPGTPLRRKHPPPGGSTPPRRKHPQQEAPHPPCGQNHRRLWKYNLAPTSLRAVKSARACKTSILWKGLSSVVSELTNLPVRKLRLLIRTIFGTHFLYLLPPANEVCEGYVFTHMCQSFCSGGGIPACLAGGILACLAGLQGGVSQHALQVSRPTPKGEVEGSGWGGLQAHTLVRGVYPSMHWGRPSPPTATAAGCTHPTGMHSCHYWGPLMTKHEKIYLLGSNR